MGGIYIWGTGCGGGELLESLPESVEIKGWVDNFPSSDHFMGRPVIKPEALKELSPELIIVSARHTQAILKQCTELQIDRDRLLFTKNNLRLEDMNTSLDRARALLGPELTEELSPPCHIVRGSMKGYRSPLSPRDYENDYVRIATLEAVCRRLQDVPGAAAELGVYKGGFAGCINALLPDRPLYLFDTFSGFDPEEAKQEKAQGNLSEGVMQAHRNTSLEKVLSFMPHREMVRPVVGYFPQSLKGLEERFCLVSLDADLEESTLAGLEYFVPRMNRGGYIFLHDYDSHRLQGVKKAVERYEQAHGMKFSALPLPDVNGTLVICM